jgi:hypothetical protein
VLVAWLLTGGYANARTILEIETGLEHRYRVGRWSPLILTLSSDRPRTVNVELRVANASSSAMTIRQQLGVGTQPQKYVVYAPVGVYYDPVQATVFDADTGKLLTRWPDEDVQNPIGVSQQIGFMMITAGRSPLMQNLRRPGDRGSAVVSHLNYPLLPTAGIGYDSADVVYLNSPDWSQITVDQQRAMIDWARAGGTIVVYPGADTIPADGPLVAALPCDVGAIESKPVTSAQRDSLRLPSRFQTLASRPLMNRPGARTVWLPESIANVSIRSIGLGNIAVVSTDLGHLTFQDDSSSNSFNHRFLVAVLGTDVKQTTPDHGYYDTDIAAANAALDRIGQIPNTGSFGFSYIALVVGGLMLIVGPIDWFVLKKLGKQPWTWATTVGWIGVFTCGAVYAGHLLRSGDLHFRTLRLLDQAGGRVVAQEDVALIYAPRSAQYAVTADTETWWQPVPSGSRYGGSSITAPIDTQQTHRGTSLDPMWIDVWNWRFLRVSKYIDQPAMIDAKLRVNEQSGNIEGTITNLTKHALSNVEIESRNTKSTPIATRIEPGATINVNQTPSTPDVEPDDLSVYRRYDQTDTSYMSVFGLSPARSDAVGRHKEASRFILYATIDSPESDLSLTDPSAVTQHNALLRAVIEPVR